MGESTSTTTAATTADTQHLPLGKPHIAMPAGGSEVACPGCRTAVTRTSKFCGQCGRRLWEPCLDCQELNSVSERFCNGCGGDLAARVAECKASVESKMAEAASLAEVGKLLDAVRVLESAPRVEHSHLASLHTTIAQRIEKYKTEREAAVQQVGSVLAAAKQLVAEVRFADAMSEIKKIPPALRNAELAVLHEHVAGKLQMAQRLREQLQAGVKSKQYEGLATVAQQLADVDPLDPAAQKLLPQLQAWQIKSDQRRAAEVIAAAVNALGQNAYRQAGMLLAKMPAIDDAELNKKFAAVKERVWLANELAHAPYITSTTLTAAARLLKLQPNDDKIKHLAIELEQRRRKSAASTDGLPPVWSTRPTDAGVAAQVELCPLPADLVAACTPRKMSPHEFVVAYGLALQSAGQAAVALDLTPHEKASWRDKLKLGGKKKQKPVAWGIDLGGHGLNAVCLEASDDKSAPGAPLTVREMEYVPYEGHTESGPPSRDGQLSESVRAAITSFTAKHDLAEANVTLSLSGPQTLARFFEMPVPSPAKFQQAAEYEAKSRIPLPPENVVFDYYTDDLPKDDDEAIARRWVTLVAANRKQVSKRMQPFTEIGCAQLQVASSPVAVINTQLAAGGIAADRGELDTAVAVLDVGGSSTNLCVIAPHKFWFRGLYLGGDGMVQSVARALQVDRQTATKFCHRPDAAAWMHEVDEALVACYQDLADQVQRSLEQCRSDTGVAIDRLLVTGSQSQTLGLVRYLRNRE